MTGIFPTNEELEAAIDADDVSSFKEFAHLLVSACTDWPTFNLKEPRDLIKELAREIPGQLTHSNVERFYKQLPASRSENWPHKLEACVAILELFRSGKAESELTLEQLIQNQWSVYQAQRALDQ
jgi:hypothetical protein